MIKLTEDQPRQEAPKEPEVIESKPLADKPNVEVKKKSNTNAIIWVVVLIIITVGLFMLYNHFKNKDGNKPEPRA